MRSNTGMTNRQGDVDLREAEVSAPVRTLAWLGLAGVDICLRSVTAETVGSDAPDLLLSSSAAHLAEWEQGLRYSSRLRLSKRGGSCCRLESAAISPVDFAGLRALARIQHRTVARALGAWWQAPMNCPSSPSLWPRSCLRAASPLVGRKKSHFHQVRWLGSEPLPRSIHWPFRVAITLLSSRRRAGESSGFKISLIKANSSQIRIVCGQVLSSWNAVHSDSQVGQSYQHNQKAGRPSSEFM